MYTVILESPPGREVARFEHSVGRYFEKSGFIVAEAVKRDVLAVVRQAKLPLAASAASAAPVGAAGGSAAAGQKR
jgi:hypothetical protein